MVNTGIVRRIDDLGRIVIPKEVRKMTGIKEGDPMEIFIDNNNNIVLKKYEPENIDGLINYTLPTVINILKEVAIDNANDKIIENLKKILKYNNEDII